MKNFSRIRKHAIEAVRSAGETLLSLFYPSHCAACQRDTEGGSHLCEDCASTAQLIRSPFCRQCSQPFDGEISGEFTCSNCEGCHFHFDSAVAAYRARGIVREFVHRFKYNGHFHLRHVLADWLAAGLNDDRITVEPFDAIVPVPLHSARERERQYNQAEVLGELIATRTGVPLLNNLERIRYTTTQTRLDREERMENLRGAFSVPHAEEVIGRNLILIDDIFTTGSTVEECSRVLRNAGAASVRVLTVARA